MWHLNLDVSPRCNRVQWYSCGCVWACSSVTWQHGGHGPWKLPGLSFSPHLYLGSPSIDSPGMHHVAFMATVCFLSVLSHRFPLPEIPSCLLPEEFLLYLNVSVKPCLLGWLPWLGTLVKYLFSLWVSFLSDPKELTIRCSQRSSGIGGHLGVYVTCWCGLGKWSVRRLFLECVEVWGVKTVACPASRSMDKVWALQGWWHLDLRTRQWWLDKQWRWLREKGARVRSPWRALRNSMLWPWEGEAGGTENLSLFCYWNFLVPTSQGGRWELTFNFWRGGTFVSLNVCVCVPIKLCYSC